MSVTRLPQDPVIYRTCCSLWRKMFLFLSSHVCTQSLIHSVLQSCVLMHSRFIVVCCPAEWTGSHTVQTASQTSHYSDRETCCTDSVQWDHRCVRGNFFKWLINEWFHIWCSLVRLQIRCWCLALVHGGSPFSLSRSSPPRLLDNKEINLQSVHLDGETWSTWFWTV